MPDVSWTRSRRLTRHARLIGALISIGFAVLAVPLDTAAAHDGELPVGDGRITKRPEIGNVYSCQTNFGGGGAQRTGGWFHGKESNKTWNPAEKPHVAGRETWPDASFKISPRNDGLSIESNGLPLDQPTGIFPVARDDPAFQFDRNPNRIAVQKLAFEIPATPVRAAQPGCLPMGMIGFTMTGVALYNALDAQGRDAAAHEIQDLCDGHPQATGQYHYHSASPCLPGAEGNFLVGWALDGYPIFGMRGADDKLLTNADLDACHGRNEIVRAQGRTYDYAYRLTAEYPYTLGCFTGQVQQSTMQAVRNGPPGQGAPKGLPKGPPPYGKSPPRY